MYKNASPQLKTLLKETFGESFFEEKITDKIKTVVDTYCATGRLAIPRMTLALLTPEEIARRCLYVVTEALNEGWQPNTKETGACFFVPSFKFVDRKGVKKFEYVCVKTGYVTRGFHPKISFKSEELAHYAGEQFVHLFQALLEG